MSIAPFPTPDVVKLDKFHMDQIGVLLEEQKHDVLVDTGKHLLYSGTRLLPAHFQLLAHRMDEFTERSFKRGACLGMGFIATKQTVTVPSQSFMEHYLDLDTYRDEGESLAEAAIRLGSLTLQLDENMMACASYAAYLNRSTGHDPDSLKAGIGYIETIAERTVRGEAAMSSLNLLEAEYAEELAGLFDGVE